jgi:hypothetical protein
VAGRGAANGVVVGGDTGAPAAARVPTDAGLCCAAGEAWGVAAAVVAAPGGDTVFVGDGGTPGAD